jgi:hypothetical protein
VGPTVLKAQADLEANVVLAVPVEADKDSVDPVEVAAQSLADRGVGLAVQAAARAVETPDVFFASK